MLTFDQCSQLILQQKRTKIPFNTPVNELVMRPTHTHPKTDGIGQLLNAFVAVPEPGHVPFVPRPAVPQRIAAAQKVEMRRSAHGVAIDQQAHAAAGRPADQRRKWLHLQRRAHHNEQIALVKVCVGQRIESLRQILAEEHNVWLDGAVASAARRHRALENLLLHPFHAVLAPALDAMVRVECTVRLDQLVAGYAGYALQRVDVLGVVAQQQAFVV